MSDKKAKEKKEYNEKQEDLDKHRVSDTDAGITTNTGVKLEEDDFILKAGERGPALIQDFNFIKKYYTLQKCVYQNE